MIDRTTLEHDALIAVSSDLYYDLADNIDTVSDEQLTAIIDANGDTFIELLAGIEA